MAKKAEVITEATIQPAVTREDNSVQMKAILFLTKVKNLFSDIRATISVRKTISLTIKKQLENFKEINLLKEIFRSCLETGVCAK